MNNYIINDLIKQLELEPYKSFVADLKISDTKIIDLLKALKQHNYVEIDSKSIDDATEAYQNVVKIINNKSYAPLNATSDTELLVTITEEIQKNIDAAKEEIFGVVLNSIIEKVQQELKAALKIPDQQNVYEKLTHVVADLEKSKRKTPLEKGLYVLAVVLPIISWLPLYKVIKERRNTSKKIDPILSIFKTVQNNLDSLEKINKPKK